MLDLEDLSTFVEVADAGGVTAAARRLGLPKSIVSRRLVRLEQDLGAQLLARTTRGAALTEAGASFREHAARVIAEIEAAREAISPEGDLCGRLRIAAPLSFGQSYTYMQPTAIALSISWAKVSMPPCAWAISWTRIWSRAASLLCAANVSRVPNTLKPMAYHAHRRNSWITSASCKALRRGDLYRTARPSPYDRKEDSKLTTALHSPSPQSQAWGLQRCRTSSSRRT
jgi:Bacterial regulatory helix-turn-helix protein, lysR family